MVLSGSSVTMSHLTREDVIAKNYGNVTITLENCVVPAERLHPTPSAMDGMSSEIEADCKIMGCEMIQHAGILLKLPQVAMATGQVLFHRFYNCKSFIRHHWETTAVACICLASKIEEAPRRIRDALNVFHHIKQVRSGRTISTLVLDQNYINLKNQVIKAERRILKELGFCVHVKHPHKIIVMYLQVLECKTNKMLVQTAWNYMNDSLRTDVFLRYSPNVVACACINMAARKNNVPLPNNPPWYGIFNVELEDIEDISQRILKLYKRPKPEIERLEKTIDGLKRLFQEAKARAKGQNIINSANSTPKGFSPPSASNSPAPKILNSQPPTREASPLKNNNNIKSDVSPKSPNSKKYISRKKRSLSPVTKSVKSRSGTVSRSRSQSSDEASHKRHSNHKRRKTSDSRSTDRKQKAKKHKRKHKRDRSSSLSLSPPAKSKKSHRDKERARSPVKSKTTTTYDKFGLRINNKHSNSSHKHKSKHSSRDRR